MLNVTQTGKHNYTQKLRKDASVLHDIFVQAAEDAMKKQDVHRFDLAKKIGVSAKSMTLLFNEDRPRCDDTLVRLADALGYEVEVVPVGTNGRVVVKVDDVIADGSKMIPRLWHETLHVLRLEIVLVTRDVTRQNQDPS